MERANRTAPVRPAATPMGSRRANPYPISARPVLPATTRAAGDQLSWTNSGRCFLGTPPCRSGICWIGQPCAGPEKPFVDDRGAVQRLTANAEPVFGSLLHSDRCLFMAKTHRLADGPAPYPGPRRGLPPSCPVTLPCSTETMPFTMTYSIPLEG
jgi:hypothetical protein